MMLTMRKEVIYTTVFLLSLASGMVWTFLLTTWPADLRRSEFRTRSCQVKEVDADGRVVWEPCDEWLRKR